MKKLTTSFWILLIIVISASFSACKDEHNVFVNSSSEFWINYHEEKAEIAINTKKDWEAVLDSQWATLQTDGGGKGENTIEITFDKNLSSEKRGAKLKLIMGGEEKELTIIQRGKKGYNDITHHFYVHLATFPVLYGGMHMLTHTQESYFVDGRQTLDKTKYPAHVSSIGAIDKPENIIHKIREINNKNPDAVFGYYGDDIRGGFVISIFADLGIDTSRVKTTLFPDGAGTYLTMFNTPYGKSGTGEVNFKSDNQNVVSFVEQCISDHNYAWEINKKGWYDNLPYQWAHHLVANNWAKYYIQDKSYLVTEDPYMKQMIQNTNYEEITPIELLSSLDAVQQTKFYDMVGFSKDKYKGIFDDSPKPNLIIIGTNTNGNVAVPPEKQANYVQQVMDKYSNTYDVFYKAHPADNAYLDYESKFPGLKLILPAKMPFEVFTWALDDSIDAIGGFNSTVFLTIPLTKVKFMFAKEPKDLGAVFETLFSDRPDIDWIH